MGHILVPYARVNQVVVFNPNTVFTLKDSITVLFVYKIGGKES